MAQYPKDEVRDRILAAALSVFAERGFPGASIAEIARRAGVSTGNVYRYYESKESLFDEVVPAAFVDRLRAVVRKRVRALGGVSDVRKLPHGHAAEQATDELLAFLLEHRLRVAIVLGRAEGTRFADVRAQAIEDGRKTAIEHFRAIDESLSPSEPLRFALERIYAGYLESLVAILLRFDDGAKVRAALESLNRYHLGGLGVVFTR